MKKKTDRREDRVFWEKKIEDGLRPLDYPRFYFLSPKDKRQMRKDSWKKINRSGRKEREKTASLGSNVFYFSLSDQIFFFFQPSLFQSCLFPADSFSLLTVFFFLPLVFLSFVPREGRRRLIKNRPRGRCRLSFSWKLLLPSAVHILLEAISERQLTTSLSIPGFLSYL